MSYQEDVALAIRRVFQLGQTYWQQADSESYRENGKSDVTLEKYRATLVETAEIAARADARIAALQQSITIRDTEIARLETDLELARIGARRYEVARRMGPRMWTDAHNLNVSTGKPFDQIIDELMPFCFPARAGNGGGA